MMALRQYPQTAPRPLIVALGVVAVLAGAALATTGPGALALCALPLVVLIAGSSWRGQFVLILLAVVVNRYSLPVGPVDVRADQLLAVVLLAAYLGDAFLGRRGWVPVPGLVPMILLIATGTIAGPLAQSDLETSVRFAVMIATGTSLLVVTVGLVTTRERLRWASGAVVAVAAVAGGFGTCMFASHLLWGTTVGIQADVAGLNPAAFGTLHEANIFGSFLAAALLVALGTDAAQRSPSLRRLAIVAISAGLAVSFTRAAWLGFAAGYLVMTLRQRDLRKVRLRPLRCVAAVGTAGCLLALLVPSLGAALLSRLGTLFDLRTGTGLGRIHGLRSALVEWREHPVLGQGFGSFKSLGLGQAPGDQPWISNLAVAILHDAGVVGALLLVWFLATLVRCCVKTRDEPAVAYLGALTALLVAFQATSGFVFGYFWVFAGLVIASGIVSGGEDPEEGEVQAPSTGSPRAVPVAPA